MYGSGDGGMNKEYYYEIVPILIEALKEIRDHSHLEPCGIAGKAIRDWDKARGTEDHKFDRVAYQREYMRKWRKK